MEKDLTQNESLIKRVVICGPESTGKSTLTVKLASYFNTNYVSEYARDYLQSVIEHKRCIPFKRFKNQVGHRTDPGVMSGRYPEKAVTEVLKLLDNIESNAEYKGMDMDRLKIINATSQKGVIIERIIPRAQGRATAKNDVLTHFEIVAQEV